MSDFFGPAMQAVARRPEIVTPVPWFFDPNESVAAGIVEFDFLRNIK